MGNKQSLPQAQNWDHFWSLDQTHANVSWSKKRIIKILEPYLVKGKSALDAGCGSGFFAKYFCDWQMQTVALDYSDQALAITREATQGRAEILKKNLLSPALPQEIHHRFDLIFSDGLLEHFSKEDQDKIFHNLFSLLSPNGVVVTFVPNRWSPWELIRPFYMPGIDETPFVLKELIDLNERNGFVVINHGGVNTLPFAFSPDSWFGSTFGMLLFTLANKK